MGTLTRKLAARRILVSVLCLGLSGCAHPFWRHAKGDPLEPLNRTIYAFNTVADKVVLAPVAKTYQTITPKPARKGVRNFLDNLQSPLILANDLLQGKFKRAAKTTARFAINSTVGLGGLVDVATKAGIEKHYEDLGQTLAVHGVPSGPYLVVPLLGPSSVRDLAGLVTEQALNPASVARFKGRQTFGRARLALNTVDNRAQNLEQVKTIRKTAVDEYASVRSIYQQYRKAMIADGKVDMENLPDFDLLDYEP